MQVVLGVDFFFRHKSRMFAADKVYCIERSCSKRNRPESTKIFVTILPFS